MRRLRQRSINRLGIMKHTLYKAGRLLYSIMAVKPRKREKAKGISSVWQKKYMMKEKKEARRRRGRLSPKGIRGRRREHNFQSAPPAAVK